MGEGGASLPNPADLPPSIEGKVPPVEAQVDAIFTPGDERDMDDLDLHNVAQKVQAEFDARPPYIPPPEDLPRPENLDEILGNAVGEASLDMANELAQQIPPLFPTPKDKIDQASGAETKDTKPPLPQRDAESPLSDAYIQRQIEHDLAGGLTEEEIAKTVRGYDARKKMGEQLDGLISPVLPEPQPPHEVFHSKPLTDPNVSEAIADARQSNPQDFDRLRREFRAGEQRYRADQEALHALGEAADAATGVNTEEITTMGSMGARLAAGIEQSRNERGEGLTPEQAQQALAESQPPAAANDAPAAQEAGAESDGVQPPQPNSGPDTPPPSEQPPQGEQQ